MKALETKSPIFKASCLAAACMLLVLLVSACASPAMQEGATSASVVNGSGTTIEELPAQAEYQPPDSASRGKVHVQVPEGYECSEYLEDVEPYTGKALKLEAMAVDMGEAGSLHIIVDDAGFLDWYYSGSMYGTATTAGYVDAAKEESFNSSWRVSVGGHDATVLIQGSAAEGWEISGDAFVFLDGATVVLSAVPPEGEAPSANAYSEFFRADEVIDLLDSLVISVEP